MNIIYLILLFSYSLSLNNDPNNDFKSCTEFEFIDSEQFTELFAINQVNEDTNTSTCWEYGNGGWICPSIGCWQMTNEYCGYRCVTVDGCSVCFICTGNLRGGGDPPLQPE